MKTLEIRKYPDKILREKCTPVSEVGGAARVLLERMLFTMRLFSGIGLSAPQVGISKRLIAAEADERVIKLVNPKILKLVGSTSMVEGCLSLPGVEVEVKRPDSVVVTGLGEMGEFVEIKAEGLFARVLQHEIDHLDGVLIVDYLSPDRKKIFEEQWKKNSK